MERQPHTDQEGHTMNITAITGRLTADPEPRFTPGGTAVTTLRVANNDRDDIEKPLERVEQHHLKASPKSGLAVASVHANQRKIQEP